MMTTSRVVATIMIAVFLIPTDSASAVVATGLIGRMYRQEAAIQMALNTLATMIMASGRVVTN